LSHNQDQFQGKAKVGVLAKRCVLMVSVEPTPGAKFHRKVFAVDMSGIVLLINTNKIMFAIGAALNLGG
jgi:hypothetical protein